MSLKSRMETEIQVMSSGISTLKAEIRDQADMYTSAGKVTFFEQIGEKYKSVVAAAAGRALQIILQAGEQYQEAGKNDLQKKAADPGYQAALGNAVSLIRNQYFTDTKVLQSIVDMFEKDEFAMSAITCAMKENDTLRMHVQNLPANSADKKEALEKLGKIVRRLAEQPYNGDLNSKEYGVKQLSMMMKYFDDNLLYTK